MLTIYFYLFTLRIIARSVYVYGLQNSFSGFNVVKIMFTIILKKTDLYISSFFVCMTFRFHVNNIQKFSGKTFFWMCLHFNWDKNLPCKNFLNNHLSSLQDYSSFIMQKKLILSWKYFFGWMKTLYIVSLLYSSV